MWFKIIILIGIMVISLLINYLKSPEIL